MTKHMAYNSLNQMVSSTTVRGGKPCIMGMGSGYRKKKEGYSRELPL